MWLNILLYICLLFLAFWGAYALTNIFFVNRNENLESILVTFKDQEQEVEEVLRNITWGVLKDKILYDMPKILVVDMKSEDGTLAKVREIAEKYSFIKLIDSNDLASVDLKKFES